MIYFIILYYTIIYYNSIAEEEAGDALQRGRC